MIILRMAWEFFKTGLFAVGGGLATIPFLRNMGERFGWFGQEELANMLAVSESTPGPIGINMATYVGNTVGGIAGGMIATLALVLPSYLVILSIQKALQHFKDNRYVQGSMRTLRPASVGMVAAAILGVLLSSLFNLDAVSALQWSQMVLIPNVLLFAVLLIIYLKYNKLHPVFILGLAAVAGILFKL